MAGAPQPRVLLACDLDNTLLYSHRHAQPGDVCVEWREGHEQGNMRPLAVALRGELGGAGIELVPVTARSLEQYSRIRWPYKAPRTALIAGGAMCVEEGRVDTAWHEASLKLAAPYGPALAGLEARLMAHPEVELCRVVAGCTLFARCSGEAAAARLAALPGDGLVLTAHGRKPSALPPRTGKGAALDRLLHRMGDCRVIGAGDSRMDVPMLARCRAAIVPNAALAAQVGHGGCVIWNGEGAFPEFVLLSALRLAGAHLK